MTVTRLLYLFVSVPEFLNCLQEPHAPSPSLVALFSFVLLDPITKRPAKVPQLQPVTPQEQQWAAERAAVAAARKAARKAAQGKPQRKLNTNLETFYLDTCLVCRTVMP